MNVPCMITRKNANGTEIPFEFRRCTAEHLSAIAALQERIVRVLPTPELFARTTEAELAESLELDFCLGAYAGGTLAMVSIMVSNRISPRNLGVYLGYEEARLLQTVTYDTTFVDPAFRGYGLQRLSFRFKDAEAAALGAREALATVAPDNDASLHNLLADGFAEVDRQSLYGGLDRMILRKTLE